MDALREAGFGQVSFSEVRLVPGKFYSLNIVKLHAIIHYARFEKRLKSSTNEMACTSDTLAWIEFTVILITDEMGFNYFQPFVSLY